MAEKKNGTEITLKEQLKKLAVKSMYGYQTILLVARNPKKYRYLFPFIPYIIESGVLDIVKECNLPESNSIALQRHLVNFLIE